ncbi:inosine/uridine-preferring nucleoside hydrolase [Capsaspora owczarzaki ATCC 30864]|uniref:Inosine/uridine-preferring nucleoside hydrolase n=1 Tax=Capsaspora owczarzaki (strain ATCC 30864) TaxID=595528 RepID=A0A0D2W0K2_CAPO3|nr:inosine/uridine-preferring nucleoside hydrolase [Capsaspora owczarzaki ATCC 30864]
MQQKLIIDTDAGVDDAVAILLALNWPGAEILAITTVAGNVDESQVAVNVAKILAFTGCSSIPIYRGAESAIIASRADSKTWAGHGVDGLGDVPIDLLTPHQHLVPHRAPMGMGIASGRPAQVTASQYVARSSGGNHNHTDDTNANATATSTSTTTTTTTTTAANAGMNGAAGAAAAGGLERETSSSLGGLSGSNSTSASRSGSGHASPSSVQQPSIVHHPHEQHAAVVISQLMHAHPDATLVMIGPLTNLALALRLDPSLADAINARPNRLVIMGGSIAGAGNVTMAAEFNFHQDPEAAYMVLAACTNPASTVIVSLECCQEDTLTWEHFDRFVESETVFAKLLQLVTQPYVRICRRRGVAGDATATAVTSVVPSQASNSKKNPSEKPTAEANDSVMTTVTTTTTTTTTTAAAAANNSTNSNNNHLAATDPARTTPQAVLGQDPATEQVSLAAMRAAAGSIASALDVHDDDGRFTPYDAFAIAIALKPSLVRESEHIFGTIELGGQLTRGMLVLDRMRKFSPPNICIVRRLRTQEMVEMMIRTFHE